MMQLRRESVSTSLFGDDLIHFRSKLVILLTFLAEYLMFPTEDLVIANQVKPRVKVQISLSLNIGSICNNTTVQLGGVMYL